MQILHQTNHVIFFLCMIISLHGHVILAKSPSSSTTTSVNDFGAVGIGGADDTSAVQSAINSNFTQVKFPAGGTYHVKTLHVPAGVDLVVEEGSVIVGSKKLKGRKGDCWGVALVAGGGGVVVSGCGKISGATLISVKKCDDKDVKVRWSQRSRDMKMRVKRNEFCIVCDHGFSCDPIHPGHW